MNPHVKTALIAAGVVLAFECFRRANVDGAGKAVPTAGRIALPIFGELPSFVDDAAKAAAASAKKA